MKRLPMTKVSDQVAIAVAAIAIVLIGWSDYATGIELRIYPLYFVPIAIVSWRATRVLGLVAAALCTLVWLVSNWQAGMDQCPRHIVLVNTSVQMTAFAVIAWLISSYNDALTRERRLARSDALTGLLNSRGFTERAIVEIARSQRTGNNLVLALIDLDHFKQVNDTLGHAAGDEILSQVGDIFQRRLRRTDIAARLGGDEFAILMPETDGAGAGVVLESIRESVAAMAAARNLPLTTSIGVCVFTRVPADVDTMLREADTLMYDAKRAGRNRITSRVVGYGNAPPAATEA